MLIFCLEQIEKDYIYLILTSINVSNHRRSVGDVATRVLQLKIKNQKTIEEVLAEGWADGWMDEWLNR